MHSLFIDSSLGLVIGLLDPKFSWIEYLILDEKRPSEIIHFEIFSLLKKYNLNLSEMRCFVSSGPGSYTGMRLSEGLAQIFELENMPVYSFYHFNIAEFCGIENGFWATNAFKNQVFIYRWNCGSVEKSLVSKDTFVIPDEKRGFTLDTNDPLFSHLVSTKSLIRERAPEIFEKVDSQKLRVIPYYFRSLDEEFHSLC